MIPEMQYMTEKTRALVTGGTGFVGSRLVEGLAAAGFDVHVLVRPGSSLKQLAPVQSKIECIEHDGSTGQLIKIVGQVRPAIVFHLASLFVAEHKSEQVTELIDSNVRFSAQLLEAMAVNGVTGLVNAGTSWQHFGSAAYRPVCLYAATKQAFEAVLDFYVDAYRVRAITLKLFDTYGPDDPRPKLFSLLHSACSRNIKLDLSPGEQNIDMVYIDDVIDAFLQAAKRVLSGEVTNKEEYAVSSGRPLSLKRIVAIYGAVCGVELKVNWGARPYRAREVMNPWNTGDPLPGWSPQVTLEEGIRRIEDRLSEAA